MLNSKKKSLKAKTQQVKCFGYWLSLVPIKMAGKKPENPIWDIFDIIWIRKFFKFLCYT
jgi:hypothetical protein